MRLGVVTGLQREAGCLRVFSAADRPAVSCKGVGPHAAASAAMDLLAAGCIALLSFGLAGGLTEDLRPGDVVIAEAVVDEDGQAWPTDPAWREAIAQRLCRRQQAKVMLSRLLGLNRPLLTPLEKKEYGKRFTASAVDMETLAVASAAAEAGVPFLAIRAVIDPVDQAVPEWLAAAVDSRGRPKPGRILAGLATHMQDLPALLRLARDERAAMRVLRRVALDAGPLFGLA
jgi:adenosylhomocysteine nucleosidase